MQNFRLSPKVFSLLRHFSTSNSKPASLNHLFIPAKNPSGNPLNLVVLHGLLGSSSNFRSVISNPKISSLANSYLLDMRNHGASEHRDTMTPSEMASDVQNFIKEKNLTSNLVIMGHSMGARATFEFCLLYPELPKAVVIVDKLPYDYDSDPRHSSGKTTKTMIEKLMKIDMNNEYKTIAEEVRAAAEDKSVADFVMMNIRKDDESGKYRWRCNLPAILKQCDNVGGVEKGKEGFKGPVKVVFGGDSDYYYEDIIPSFKNVFPNINREKDIVVIKGAGHWVHSSKPAEFVDEVANFLKSL